VRPAGLVRAFAGIGGPDITAARRALVMRSVIAVTALVVALVAVITIGLWWRPGAPTNRSPNGPREHIDIADWDNHRLLTGRSAQCWV